MNFKLKSILLTAVLMLGLVGNTWAHEIDADFARHILFLNGDVTRESEVTLNSSLDSLDQRELETLRAMISEDLNKDDSELISNNRMSLRLAHQLVNNLDARLGTLEYDQIVDSRKVEIKFVERFVYVNDSNDYTVNEMNTVMPYYGFDGTAGENFLMYIKDNDVVKITIVNN